MWILKKNKIININTGILLKIEEIKIMDTKILNDCVYAILLKKLGIKDYIVLFHSKNKTKIFLIFKKIKNKLLIGAKK